MKKSFVFLVLILIFTGCEKETIGENNQEQKTSENSLITSKHVSLQEIPEIGPYIRSIIKSRHSAVKKSSDEFPFGEIDTTKVFISKDTIGSLTYTFLLQNNSNNDSEPYYFDNLIISKKVENSEPTAFILRYTPKETHLTANSTSTFRAKINYFPLHHFSFQDIYNKQSACTLTYTYDCGLSGHHESLDEPGCTSSQLYVSLIAECPDPSSPYPTTETINTEVYTATGDTSEDPLSGGGGSLGGGGTTTPIITPYDDDYETMLKYDTMVKKLSLNTVREYWLRDFHNYDFAMALYDYLGEHGFSDASINFGNEALDAKRHEGEVDFDNQIIKDASFIGTKADCVLEALINSGNNIFKTVSAAFTEDKSEFRLKFTAYNDSSDRAIARTPFPTENTSTILIRFNTYTSGTMNAIDLASKVLHETIHAELHRIKLAGNNSPYPLPEYKYNWYIQMWEAFEYSEDTEQEVATASEHNLMANLFINPIAEGIRAFDEFQYDRSYYLRYAWDGLEYEGKQNGYITMSELEDLANLTLTVMNDAHENPCD